MFRYPLPNSLYTSSCHSVNDVVDEFEPLNHWKCNFIPYKNPEFWGRPSEGNKIVGVFPWPLFHGSEKVMGKVKDCEGIL